MHMIFKYKLTSLSEAYLHTKWLDQNYTKIIYGLPMEPSRIFAPRGARHKHENTTK
jgi:hypothetical protein